MSTGSGTMELEWASSGPGDFDLKVESILGPLRCRLGREAQIWLPSQAVLANNVFANILGGFEQPNRTQAFLSEPQARSPRSLDSSRTWLHDREFSRADSSARSRNLTNARGCSRTLMYYWDVVIAHYTLRRYTARVPALHSGGRLYSGN